MFWKILKTFGNAKKPGALLQHQRLPRRLLKRESARDALPKIAFHSNLIVGCVSGFHWKLFGFLIENALKGALNGESISKTMAMAMHGGRYLLVRPESLYIWPRKASPPDNATAAGYLDRRPLPASIDVLNILERP